MKKLLTLSCALIGILFSQAQTQQPLIQYGFDVIPSSVTLNPAFQSEKPIFIGVPVLGGLHFSAFSRDLTFRDAIKRENSSRTILDRDNISSVIEENSYLNVQLSTDILLGGFKSYDGGFWSFGFKINTELDNRFSNDFTDFILYGNYDSKVYDRWLDFSAINHEATVYSKLHVGYSRDINKRLRVGARLNILSGLAYVGITENSLKLKTDPNAAIPNSVLSKGVLQFSTAGIDFSDDSTQISYSPINFKNLGIGIDLGVDYMFNKKLYLSASIIDLGFIKWSDHGRHIGVDVPSDWRYEGFTFEPNGDKDLGDEIDEWSDNLEDDLNLDTVDNAEFTTYLQSKIFLSGKYRFNRKYSMNMTFKGEFDRGGFEPGVSLAYQAKVAKFLDLVGGVSYQDRQAGVGAGVNFSIGAFNWYFLTDNLNAFFTPAESRGTNFSMGMNVQLGKEKSNAQYGKTRWAEDKNPDAKKETPKMKKKRLKREKKEAKKKAKKEKKADNEEKTSEKTKKNKKEKEKKSKDTVKKRTDKKKKKNEL